MQIAICDDDNGVCSQLETWILEYQDDNGVKIDIDIYNTAEELFASLKDGKWVDIIFFDIELFHNNMLPQFSQPISKKNIKKRRKIYKTCHFVSSFAALFTIILLYLE